MEFKSGTKMRENYFSKLQRQNLILILRCRRGRKKERQLVHKDSYPFTPSSFYIDGRSVVRKQEYVSEPGTNAIGSSETGRNCTPKHQKKNANSRRTMFPSSRIPNARMKRIEREQGRLWTQCLLHGTLLLKPRTSPTPAPSVSSLPSSAGRRLSRLGQSWAGRNHIIHFQSLKKTPMCHHQQWAAGAAGFGARRHSKWLAAPRHMALSQDSMCSLSLPSSGFSRALRLHTHAHICIHTHSYLCAHPHGHTTHTLIFTCLCTHMLIHTHLHTRTCMCTHDLTTAASTVLWPCERHGGS